MRKPLSTSPEKIRESLPPNLRELVDELVAKEKGGDEDDEEESDKEVQFIPVPHSDRDDLEERGVIILDKEISKQTLARPSARLLSLHFDPAFNEAIQIIINSPGGYMDAMWSFIDLMETCRLPIRTIAMGEICSAATMIFVAGNERMMAPNSSAMIHHFTTWAGGSYPELLAVRKSHDMEAKRIEEHFLRYSKYNKLKDIREKILLSHDNWLSPKEMKKHGLCDTAVTLPRRKKK